MTLAVRSSLLGDDRRILKNNIKIIICIAMIVNYYGSETRARTWEFSRSERGALPTWPSPIIGWVTRGRT